MSQATFSVRMDETLKRQFDSLCADFGMNASTAINVFARAVVRERKIPFEITAPEPDITREKAMQTFLAIRKQAAKDFPQGMQLDEINEEIRKARYDEEETMFISVHSLVIMGIGTLVTIFFLIMLITSGKYDMYLETLDSKEYPFFQLYGVGFRINDLIGMDFSRKSERKRRQHLALLKGDQLAEYYLRVNAAERTTFASLCIVASFILYGISQEIMILVILIGYRIIFR